MNPLTFAPVRSVDDSSHAQHGRFRHLDAQFPSVFHVDDHLERRCLSNRRIPRLGSFVDLVDVDRRLADLRVLAHRMGQEFAFGDEGRLVNLG